MRRTSGSGSPYPLESTVWDGPDSAELIDMNTGLLNTNGMHAFWSASGLRGADLDYATLGLGHTVRAFALGIAPAETGTDPDTDRYPCDVSLNYHSEQGLGTGVRNIPARPNLSRFVCGAHQKEDVSATPRFCVTGDTDATRRSIAGRLLQNRASFYSARGRAGTLPVASVPEHLSAPHRQLVDLFYCFVPAASVEVVREPSPPYARMLCDEPPPAPDGLPNLDPGVLVDGDLYDLQTDSTLQIDAGSAHAATALTGNASIAFRPDGTLLVGDLHLYQTDALSYSGYSFTNGIANIGASWPGTWDSTTGTLSIPAVSAPLHVDYVQTGGLAERHRYGAQLRASTPLSGLRAGTTVTVDALFDDPMGTATGGVAASFRVHLRMVPRAPRPTVEITSLRNADTGAQLSREPLECRRLPSSGLPGARVTATGTRSGGVGGWTLVPDAHPMPIAGGSGPSATFDVPLGPRFEPESAVRLSTNDNGLYAGAQRAVRVVDTQPPVASASTLAADLRLGCALTPPDLLQLLCDTSKNYPVADTCDPNAHANLQRLRVLAPDGRVLDEFRCGERTKLPTEDPSAVFEVLWNGVDSWDNRTPDRMLRVTFTVAAPDSTCPRVRTSAEILFDGPLSADSGYLPRAGWSAEPGRLAPGAAALGALGLDLRRDSPATVQTGLSTVVTGLASNIARVGADGGGHHGLVLEESRTNLVPYGRGNALGSWYAGYLSSTVPPLQAGPDGGSTAARLSVNGGGYSPFQAFGPRTGSYVGSAWLRAASTPGLSQLHTQEGYQGAVARGSADVLFRRVSAANNYHGGYAYLVPADGRDSSTFGGGPAGAVDVLADLFQFESGAFPTEYIETAGASSTRATERLTATVASAMLDGGSLALEFRLQPKGAWFEYPMAVYLWWIDELNYALLDPATGVVTVKIQGVPSSSIPSPTWSRLDTLELFLVAGGGVTPELRWRGNGGSVWVGGFTGPALPPVVAPAGAVYLLNRSGDGVLSSYVQQVTAWHRARRPNWAR